LVISSSFGSVQSSLGSLGTIASVTSSSPEQFDAAAAPQVTGGGVSIGLVGTSASGPVVVAAVGTQFKEGDVFTGARAAAVSEAMPRSGLVATTLLSRGATNVIGMALGSP